MSTEQPATPTSEQLQVCAKCNSSQPGLRKCAKCKSANYCNRECQTAHWKDHKKECSRIAHESETSPPSGSGSGSGSIDNATKPFTSISNNTFLHNRPEKETFRMLVDLVRLRQEDTYNLEGDTMTGTIYDGFSSSEPALRDMLQRAKRVQGLLPPWWSDLKEEECIRENRQNLKRAQEKSDIQDHWKDPTMPMKLRLTGENIYGSQPGSIGTNSGQTMLQLQMKMEAGGFGSEGVYSHIDVNNMLNRRCR